MFQKKHIDIETFVIKNERIIDFIRFIPNFQNRGLLFKINKYVKVTSIK